MSSEDNDQFYENNRRSVTFAHMKELNEVCEESDDGCPESVNIHIASNDASARLDEEFNGDALDDDQSTDSEQDQIKISDLDNMRSLRRFQSQLKLAELDSIGALKSNRDLMSKVYEDEKARRRSTNPRRRSTKPKKRRSSIEEAKEEEEEEEHGTHLSFYTRPLQRQYWDEPFVLPHVNWGDLFFDLFYVAGAYNVANLIKKGFLTGYALKTIVYFLGLSGPVFQIWFHKFLYDARFTIFDYFHRIVETFRILFLGLAILHLKDMDELVDPSNRSTLAFSFSLTIELILTILLNVELLEKGVGDVAVKIQSKNLITRTYLPQLAFYLASTLTAFFFYRNSENFDKDHHRYLAEDNLRKVFGHWSTVDIPFVLLLCGYVVSQLSMIFNGLFYKGSQGERAKVVPMNMDFAIHRLGEWVMLMLGESILSLLIVDVTAIPEYYAVVASGIITVILLQDLHFEAQPSHGNYHAMRRSHLAGVFYMYLVQVQSAALICLGVGYKIMLTMITEQAAYDEYEAGGHRGLEAILLQAATIYGRVLGGGGPNASLTPENKRIAANVVCASLTTVLIVSDLTTITHRGIQNNLNRFKKERKHVIFVGLKVAIYVATLTLPLWLTDPWWLAIVCMGIVILAVGLRFVGWELFRTKLLRLSILNSSLKSKFRFRRSHHTDLE